MDPAVNVSKDKRELGLAVAWAELDASAAGAQAPSALS